MIDRNRLKSLLGEEASLVPKFLALFKEQTPRQLDQLRAGIANADWPEVALLAHGIKSQCQYLGLEGAAGLALQIEQLADGQRALSSVPRLADSLEQDLLRVIREELG